MASFKLILLTLLSFITSNVIADNLEDLAKDGYGVIEKTYVRGEFEGCDYDKRIPLANGMTFTCRTYSYSYSYQPEVLILKNVNFGTIKVLINGNSYDGNLR